jgi:alpha/beta superfamily hydrolase
VPDKLNLFGFTIGKAYFAKLFNYDLLKETTKYHGPVLIMHGTSDLIIPDNYSIKTNKKFKHSKLYLFKNAGHDFKGKYQTRAFKLIDDFLQKDKV